jgi:energy-converting hydrogenase A subunit R
MKSENSKKIKGLVAIDCEGPLTKNDNALELSKHFLPDGERLFTQLSRYDDILASMIKRPGYRAGNTLKLICPFFRAFGIGNQDVMDFSARHILMMSGADALLRWINENAHGFIVSTSYRPYIQALCNIVGFPFRNTYCTNLDLDFLIPSKEECDKVQKMADKIVSLPSLEWPSDIKSLEELPGQVKRAFTIIDEIIMNELKGSYLGGYLERVEPIGGEEKARSVRDSCERTGQNLSRVIYIGDSITDVEAFQLVRKNEGMTVAFNGNRYAIEAAELACLSHHSDILAIICQVFWDRGRQGVMEMIEDWQTGFPFINQLISNSSFREAALEKEQKSPSHLEVITAKNRFPLIKKSEAFRGQVRGEAIGRLG